MAHEPIRNIDLQKSVKNSKASWVDHRSILGLKKPGESEKVLFNGSLSDDG
jgi:hypothetical protein